MSASFNAQFTGYVNLQWCGSGGFEIFAMFGFMESLLDQSLFIYVNGDISAYFLVYVDDIVLISSSEKFTNIVIMRLGQTFAIKDLDPLRYFLGIHITLLENEELFIAQVSS